ncbi:MAG: hypothetical protein II777_09590 [Clostridia bacterium]|nr:hypothetical protein [Clostridia bacterium]
MKKLFITLACIVTLAAALALSAFAIRTDNGVLVYDADRIEEILSCEAGERDIRWDVPFLANEPKIDGVIDEDEYLPFENYMPYMSKAAFGKTNENSFQKFIDSTEDNILDAYWGWDGTYLYIAFTVHLVNGYHCDPEADYGSSILLYNANCLQLGFADPEATGKDKSYNEIGFGVNSEDGHLLVESWAGQYLPEAGKDFMGEYDRRNETVTYEIRLRAQSLLGLTDRAPQNGDQLNYAFVLALNGDSYVTGEVWQLLFCHGIGAQYSMKLNEYFARITFTGKPDNVEGEVINYTGLDENEQRYGLLTFADMSLEAVTDTIKTENARAERTEENGEAFLRFYPGEDEGIPYFYFIPGRMLADNVSTVAVKYRTSSPHVEDLGIVYRNMFTEYIDPDYCYTETVGNDGDWHVVLFDMEGEDGWTHFIVDLGIVAFPAGSPADEYVDIAWIKGYTDDPRAMYSDMIYKKQSAVTEAQTETGTESEAETETDTQTVTDAATNAPETKKPDTGDKDVKKTGKFNPLFIIIPAAAAVIIAVVIIVILKKKAASVKR